jgi:hypothetical protein
MKKLYWDLYTESLVELDDTGANEYESLLEIKITKRIFDGNKLVYWETNVKTDLF